MKFARPDGPRRRRVLTTLGLLGAGVAFAAAPAARPAPPVVRGEVRRFLVHFEDSVRNEGEGPLRDVTCDALLPLDTPRQRVRWVRLSSHAWDVRRDVHGQTIASARVREIPPGGSETFAWIASVDLAAETHEPFPACAALPVPEAAAYLGDSERFGVRSAPVRAAADEARRRAAGGSPLALAEAAAGVVRERVRFELAGGWDPAPAVLARGTGSCSESTFALVAVCRNLGLPARWTGGTVLRAGAPGRTCDETFHRIAEVWLPGHGWWPVETQEGRDEGAPPEADTGPRGAAPAIRRGFLLLGRGDGTGDAAMGASYHSRVRWGRGVPDRPAARPRVSKRAWWLAGVPDELALDGAVAGLADGSVPSFPRAELLACDARGYGPPRDADGRLLATAPRRGDAPDPGAVAERLLRAGHPEGLRLAAQAFRGDAASLRALAAAHCDEVLAEEFLAASAASEADFESWWAAAGPRIAPVARGRLALATRAP